jgi:hypothetical protein
MISYNHTVTLLVKAMQVRNYVRLSIFILMGLVFIALLVVLYTGGNLKFAGIYERVRPATFVITLSILFLISSLLKTAGSFKQVVSENSFAFLICIVLILYSGNYQTSAASDTAPARYLPFSLFREGDFDLDEFRNLHQHPYNSGLIKVGSHYLSSYPVGAAIFALPYYFPSAIGHALPNTWISSDLEKLAASFTVLLSVIVLYFTILRLSSRNVAFIVAAIYALATSSFSVSSQALWQHGASQLCLSGVLYCVVRGSQQPLWTIFAGFPASFAVVCRPTDALLIIPVGVYVLFHRRKQFPGFVLAGIPPVLFQLIYNKIYFENFFRTQWDVSQGSFWSTPLIDGAANILFSPGRGLFIYSPIFVFSLIGMILCWKKGGNLLFRYLSIGVIANLYLYSKFFMWWGGYTYGPRLLADLTPVLCSFLVFVIPILKSRWIKTAFAVLALWSFGAHAIGAYANDPFWNPDFNIDSNPHYAWQWKDNQLVNSPRRTLDSIRIQLMNTPTTQTHPQLFNAEIKTDLPEIIQMKPSRELAFSLEAMNTGSAAWAYGSLRKAGNVSIALNWYRKDLLLERFTVRRRLRYNVFPGDTYTLLARTKTPDREGRFILEVAIMLSKGEEEIFGKTKQVLVLINR